jgi:hypothetical protein
VPWGVALENSLALPAGSIEGYVFERAHLLYWLKAACGAFNAATHASGRQSVSPHV